uniref:DNA-dependent RNA polymerase n=1 Tax=Spizellomyces sp. 'palustris' TaxID=117820 RepID=UPI0010FBC80A|nr:DNA-dependent RNA polymerase [Spizellomyces sp. 'palustris']QCQ69024.1 DNA-dependent RNA polymerase [Spizellomyces sp. 'palustris']
MRLLKGYIWTLFSGKVLHTDVRQHAEYFDNLEYNSIWEADEPYLFSQAMAEFDIIKWRGRAIDYSLPLFRDCTCNGLQIISLLTRNRELATQVNLVDNTRYYDVYTYFAQFL